MLIRATKFLSAVNKRSGRGRAAAAVLMKEPQCLNSGAADSDGAVKSADSQSVANEEVASRDGGMS